MRHPNLVILFGGFGKIGLELSHGASNILPLFQLVLDQSFDRIRQIAVQSIRRLIVKVGNFLESLKHALPT